MSIGKKNKDHLKAHGNVSRVEQIVSLKSNDPLRFWTNHPTENTLVDLHPFAYGEVANPHPLGPKAGVWGGAFTGRPNLIAELAPSIEARCVLLGSGSVKRYTSALRAWWRFFDHFENDLARNGSRIERIDSVNQLNEIQEAAAHRQGLGNKNFVTFISIVNDARRLLRIPALLWVPPKSGEPIRNLISDEQARELKVALKQAWEVVRGAWAKNDVIRAEAEKRLAGEPPTDLGEQEERRIKNWHHFREIQKKTGETLPSAEQLIGNWKSHQSLSDHGLAFCEMRAVLFPTVEEAEVAYHLALMNSGWNPSTLSNLDATSPFLVADHPKDQRQLVLSDNNDQEITLSSDKPRARGKTQFCSALKKNASSTPMIVANYLVRVHSLREKLKQDYQAASSELARTLANGANEETIAKQVKHVQELLRGCRSVWLYVDRRNQINWIDGMKLPRYERKGEPRPITYLGLVVEQLNQKRHKQGKPAIPPVKPSDFRDIYARWVYKQSGGNILAVMLALGHSRVGSTVNYLENNIFSSENNQQVRHFMTSLFAELGKGRVDLTILAQLVRHGPLTPEMEARLNEYRKLMKSRIGAGCADPRHPPESIAPDHKAGRLCGTHRCLKDCPNAKFLPESLDGIAMRVEELIAMFDHLPRETWLRGEFDAELGVGEYLLETLYQVDFVAASRKKWKNRILSGEHLVPGLGYVTDFEEAI
ncbi:site-specific integrase [Azonexus hydrophilus]|uniref:site-specific integrase n=1 Tax=Azonexus hydrophilus TaxID=418702 RepID=UPI001962620E|nr:site-specific integrase [Azonexus hydrophilus]